MHTTQSPRIKAGTGWAAIALLGLSAWCGTIAGLLEVVSVFVHKRFFDTNQLLSMTRHFIWLFPLADLVIFLFVGVIGIPVVIIWPAGGVGLLCERSVR